jgi:tRNA(adenine34) deaminase
MNDIDYMSEALKMAKKALKCGDIPVGAVIVKDEKIIAKAYNQKEKTKDVTNHAEIIAIRKACKKIRDWRLDNCKLYVTLEPCQMCMNAILQSRIKTIIYATNNLNNKISYNQVKLEKIKSLEIENESSKVLREFFQNKRK